MKPIHSLLSLVLIFNFSCSDSTTKNKSNLDSSSTSKLDGFWERKGTIQFVNGKPIDTIIFGVDEVGFRNYKAFGDGSIFWINNSKSQTSPWKGGAGGYGKFKNTNDTLTEFMSHGSGSFGAFLHYMNDSLKTNFQEYKFGFNLTEKNYTQLGGNVPNSDNVNITFGEFYEKKPALRKSKMDGVWKRAYEITYLNGVAIDTTTVPSDAILDVKIIKDGYVLVQVDQTRMVYDSSKSEYGGGGAFGQIDYDGNGNMTEYFEFFSGEWPGENPPRDPKTAHYARVSFYDNDMYLQITKDTLNQNAAGRGVVYKRIQ